MARRRAAAVAVAVAVAEAVVWDWRLRARDRARRMVCCVGGTSRNGGNYCSGNEICDDGIIMMFGCGATKMKIPLLQ